MKPDELCLIRKPNVSQVLAEGRTSHPNCGDRMGHSLRVLGALGHNRDRDFSCS